MFERFDRPNTQHGKQVEGHVRGAEVFEHIAREREGQSLTAEFHRPRNRIPALLDIVFIGLGEARGQAHHAVLELGAFEIAHAVERGPFARREFADPADDRLDHIGFCGGELFGLGKLLDAGIDADGKQLVLRGGGIGHGGILLALCAGRYSARA